MYTSSWCDCVVSNSEEFSTAIRKNFSPYPLLTTITERKFNEGSFICVHCAKINKYGGSGVSGQCNLTGNITAMWKFSHVVLGIDLWHFCGLCRYGWKSSTEWGPGRGAVVLSPHALYLTFRGLQRSVWSNPQRYQCVPVSRHCSQTYLRTHQTARAPEIPHTPHLTPLSGYHAISKP